ncbi:MAG TPA: GNAT family N-acetyltransferase [Lachnospiraceae bacterium]|nr:GNAT family N-acetyltransferase [Lachnospiraceae bacterium]
MQKSLRQDTGGEAGGSVQENRNQEIKYMEEMSLNAWPSYRAEFYDGWLLRYSHNYTYRTNSVEQIGESTIPLGEKIAYCEEIYRELRCPANFKIQPLLDPGFDRMLEDRGYAIRHRTDVMTMDIRDSALMEPAGKEYLFDNRLNLPTLVHFREDLTVQLKAFVTEEWMQGLFSLNGTSDPTLRRIVPKMYAAIPKKTIVASVEIDGRMVASGLGIRDRDWVGIYAIYVSPSCWNRGYARAVCSTLLREAECLGARRAYLQVTSENRRARRLYESLGFSDFYTYWFRSRRT